jgi:nitrate reductase (NAD(P)H)
MMPDYHIGTLSATALKVLTEAGEATSADNSPRPVFLQSKAWSKAILTSKERISSDTKIFSFSLDHETQAIGLPVGQHLMLRLRDPVTREAIIRAYTPISEGTEQGKLHVLVKIYYDSPDRKGGKMTQALDSIPVGHFVEFKGPVGKFEYLGQGVCSIGGKKRAVKKFVMICAGSGITPIYQVLRAVVKDPEDPTTCLVLDGNRVEELDELAKMEGGKCEIVHTLTRPEKGWKGLTGRMDGRFLEEKVGRPGKEEGGDKLVLICGPESMENSTRDALKHLGWRDEDLLFF